MLFFAIYINHILVQCVQDILKGKHKTNNIYIHQTSYINEQMQENLLNTPFVSAIHPKLPEMSSFFMSFNYFQLGQTYIYGIS